MAEKEVMFDVVVRAEEGIAQIAKYREEIEATNEEIARLRAEKKMEGADIETLNKKIERQTQVRKGLEKAIGEETRTLQNSIKEITHADGSLAQLRAQLSKLNQEYDNLSRTDRESDIGAGLMENINTVTAEIKAAEYATQRFYRNVGNYPSQLGMSVQQVARELPSLTMGVNTFFLAISNNLPMLADQIKAARAEFKEAVAAGRDAVPVWKQFFTSLVSWQTAIVVIITLLSAYGKEIIGFVSGLFKQKEAFDAASAAAEDYNRTMTEARTEGMKDISQLQTLYHIATDVKRSTDLRREAVEMLRKEYPAYLQHLSDEEIMTGKAAGAYKQLRDQMLEMAKTRAILNRLTELNEAQVSGEYETYVEAQRKAIEANKQLEAALKGEILGNTAKFGREAKQARKDWEEAKKAFEEAYKIPTANADDVAIYIEETSARLLDGITTVQTSLDTVTEDTTKKTKQTIEEVGDLLDKMPAEVQRAEEALAKELDKQAGERAKAQAKALSEAIKLATDGLQASNPFVALEEQYATALQTIKSDATLAADERAFYELALETQLAKKKQDLQQKLNAEAYNARLKAASDEMQLAWDNAEKQYQIKRDFLQKELEDERLTAVERAKLEQELAELNAQTTQKKISAYQNYAQQVTQVVAGISEVFSGFNEAQLKNVEQTNEKEKESLKKKLDAGIISQERYNREIAKMDEELDAQKAEMEYNQAVREKALSAAQIAINTATAIAKIWAEVPKVDFGVSTVALTAMASAVGAAQIAAVLATPIPKARKGGLIVGASHEQGGVLVNTEGGERIISTNPAKAFPELLNLISYIGKHSSVPDTGFASRQVMAQASGGVINAEELAQQIGASVGEELRRLRIYLSLTELNEAERLQTRIDNSAKI